MKRHGFTLIELLVVIAIISLLVSILLPSLKRAKDIARQVMCSTQMRGIGSTASLFAEEHNGFLPALGGENPYYDSGSKNPNGYDGTIELQLYAQGKGDIGHGADYSPWGEAEKQADWLCPCDTFSGHTLSNGDMRSVSYAPNNYAWADTARRLHGNDPDYEDNTSGFSYRSSSYMLDPPDDAGQ